MPSTKIPFANLVQPPQSLCPRRHQRMHFDGPFSGPAQIRPGAHSSGRLPWHAPPTGVEPATKHSVRLVPAKARQVAPLPQVPTGLSGSQ